MRSARIRRRFRGIAPAVALAAVTASAPAPPETGAWTTTTAATTTAATATATATAATTSKAALAADPLPCRSPGHVKPTVVMVHGAWAGTSSWAGEVDSLHRAGYVARAVANPLRDLVGDAAFVADFLRTVSGPIVLVGHSYGGSVITNAAADVPNVKALVYVDAAAPDTGETTGGLSGRGSALSADPASLYDTVSYPGAPRGATDLYLKRDTFVRSFASDLPRDTAVRLWASQRPASTSAFSTPSRAAAWKTIPSWYFISTGDRIITPSSQRLMAHRARSKVTEFRGGSHLTLISHPEAVTAVIGSAICSVR
ncbi:alpha/beta hydrolase [Streptosporangium sp. NPDC002524]|uniref:alpha/beta hydrolase n=1 Tax=Streptosporangium sp. NPDC002524 TaxID=3154537 RepID=UPI003330A6D1